MIIFQSEIELDNSSCIIKTPFEIKGERQNLWYKLPIEYKDFVVTENIDSALVALLPLAMKNNENISVKGQISARLHYTLNTYLIRALNLTDNTYNIINIEAERLNVNQLSNKEGFNVATGISCGIDSFSTIATHGELEKNEYAVNYLTYFKAGSHGIYGGEISNKIFEKGIDNAKKFAKEMNLPIIIIESNIGEIINIGFQKLHSILQLSCVLNIQKGISTYYYASAFRYDYFDISNEDTSGWDIILIQYLQTESLSFFSSVVQFTRLERTKLVANYKPSYNYLDVCLDSFNAKTLNCSKCEKCVRTMLSLELLGKIENYKNVFDLSVYKGVRDNFIGRLLLSKNLNQINQEIYLKLKLNNQIKFKHYVIAINICIFSKFNRFKKNIKNKLK
ncbi:hypothetical protein FPF71_14955 [Algibacter amylolyticus]|uniref:Uncharacterized protein n=1 Tax=Algibacter amylolyticus TaxID=1608400 RepID=A0A5M7B5A6_9FLAO|nr:hypothetical protein [Algibacter amylolyticus]KAA5822441.1 hypothetical protein F2B50_14955 [Algibacter amylolyticus]MBB5269164.1 hypothetical protein [Algibacter amylolyticus]TSJ73591.1 hypothetical protein FPF71_14955 [Algibacter amylolyticus]